jgi:hypothetical protein
MKKMITIIFLYSIISYSQFTTPNTGITWNLDSLVQKSGGVVIGTFPNYSINALITVSANDLVRVRPGSIVTFTSTTAGFDVNGILQALGDSLAPILFTASVQDSLGAYNGFTFNDTSIDSLCIIRFSKIEYAYYGLRCIGSSPTLDRSYLFKCRRGVQLSNSNSLIFRNKIERSYEYGINMTLGSNPTIVFNSILNNNTQNTSAKNQVSIGLQGNNSPIIKYNTISGSTNSKTGGISLWVSGSTSFSNMVVEGNVINNNSFGITLYSTSSGVINASIKNNKIFNNNINTDPLTSGSGINVNGGSTNTPIITGNEIFGNWWGITIQNGTTVQPGPQPNIGDVTNVDTSDDGKNIIYNNIQGTNIYDIYNNCSNDIKAQNNDWRVYDSSSIEQHVYHKVDDPSRGLIQFIPFSQYVPVELARFTAQPVGNSIELKWTTISEKNNKGFLIEVFEHSVQDLQWKTICNINGHGTTTEIHDYSFIDKREKKGNYKYRLTQIDFDGTRNQLATIDVNLEIPINFILFQNYPNPFNPSSTIKFSLGSNEFVTLKIFDVLGNEVATMINETKQAGNYTADFDPKELGIGSGVYYYQLKAGSFVETKKMVYLK